MSTSTRATQSPRRSRDSIRREKYVDGFVEDCSIQKPRPEPSRPQGGFVATSLALSIQNNVLLSADTSNIIRFSAGVVEGSGVSINASGDTITFSEDGAYQFVICGEATPFSDVNATLVYDNPAFTPDDKLFSQTEIPIEGGKLQFRGIITTLSLQRGQTIHVKIITTPQESVIVMAGTRLLIHRVA